MDMIIGHADAGKTILTYTRQDLGFSSAMLKKMKFTEGGILVNGSFVTVRYVLREGDHLHLSTDDRDDDVSPYITPSALPIDILFEDEHLTIVNKPADMPAHPSFGHRGDTVANALAYRYAEKPYVFRPVNRLDRDTSGVMLTANNKPAAYRMYLSMTSGAISKYYLAVTEGIMPSDSGTLTGYIHRAADSIMVREMCSIDAPGAQEAITVYRVLAVSGTHSLVLVSPITGRTHQIRVHFADAGCPLVGDTLYGSASTRIARHALHAFRTDFPHPHTNKRLTVFAPVPDDMRSLLDALGFRDPMQYVEEIQLP